MESKLFFLALGVPFFGLCYLLQSTVFVLYLVLFFLVLRLYCRFTVGMCDSDVDMTGKTVLITGASAGIGKATAEELARRSARVIMACRNLEKAERVAEEIRLATGNRSVLVKQLELTSFESVRKCALDMYRTGEELDVLINNAGTGDDEVKFTKDGCESIMQSNHLGHFLLTMLLIDLLKRGSPGRIINISSILYACGLLDVNDLAGAKETPLTLCLNNLYSRSKLANVLFTRELASRLAGTGITVNAVHPGVVKTDILNGKHQFVAQLVWLLMQVLGKNMREGAQTSVYLAVHPEVEKVTGKFFADCRPMALVGNALNDKLAKRLFEVSEMAVKAHLTPISDYQNMVNCRHSHNA